jgi:hypothetical protein
MDRKMAVPADAATLRTVIEVRAAFETGTYDEDIAVAAYQADAPVPDIELFLRRARVLFPALNCGLCSAYLRAVLGFGSMARTRYNGHPHTVLAVDNVIIDITADQFGGPPTYVGAVQPPWILDEPRFPRVSAR